MVSIQVLATPINGLRKSSSVNPMALNMERDGARSRPSVIPRLRCLRSMIVTRIIRCRGYASNRVTKNYHNTKAGSTDGVHFVELSVQYKERLVQTFTLSNILDASREEDLMCVKALFSSTAPK